MRNELCIPPVFQWTTEDNHEEIRSLGDRKEELYRELLATSGIAPLAGVVALQGVELENFFIALVLLGIGWNFGFIGATTMLAGAHAPEERGRVQGMNDMIVFGCVTIASLASGGLMNCSGGSTVEGWSAVNLAMVPFLALAGASLSWLMLRPQEDVA